MNTNEFQSHFSKLNLFLTVLSLWGFILGTGEAQGVVNIYPVVEANLRLDSFGRSYTNLYGISTLTANLNSVNDDRVVFEFPMSGIPQNSTISSASLVVYVALGGGTKGSVGSFDWSGYIGDGNLSMNDYFETANLLRSFTENVPPTFGLTSFNFTAFVQSQNSGGAVYDGFLLRALSQNVEIGFGGPGNPYPLPVLQVTYTAAPEPNTTLLFWGGIVAFACYRHLLGRNSHAIRQRDQPDAQCQATGELRHDHLA